MDFCERWARLAAFVVTSCAMTCDADLTQIVEVAVWMLVFPC